MESIHECGLGSSMSWEEWHRSLLIHFRFSLDFQELDLEHGLELCEWSRRLRTIEALAVNAKASYFTFITTLARHFSKEWTKESTRLDVDSVQRKFSKGPWARRWAKDVHFKRLYTRNLTEYITFLVIMSYFETLELWLMREDPLSTPPVQHVVPLDYGELGNAFHDPVMWYYKYWKTIPLSLGSMPESCLNPTCRSAFLWIMGRLHSSWQVVHAGSDRQERSRGESKVRVT